MLVIALCVWSVQAQSGRKHAKPPPAAAVPTPTPEATPTPKKAGKETELLFFIGANRQDSFASLPLSYHDAALRGCVDRLRAGSSGSIDVTDRSFSRGEAIKKAKSDTGSYVVLLTLKFDTMARSYDDLILEYVVFAPGTAKVVTTGRSYPTGNRKGPVIAGPTSRGSTSALYRERLLIQAGEDAGSRILKALHLNVGIPKGP
ncbi:MAG TPA: hypothetical protein VKB02_03895 [Pyrinomonadaceae bacterium]|nr:hypothetical protein [Pyrinomonadaceae bacterium]